ncbi:unnamed protein product [Discosporangium mesarthrocarpum]
MSSGTMTLLAVDKTLENPAFVRYHPSQNVMYCCTEDIMKDNEVAAFAVSPGCGQLTFLGSQTASGKSTCYLTVDIPQQNLLFVNYWDSVIGTMPLTRSGMIRPVSHKLSPATPVVANDLQEHLANRQSEPHAHAIVLDPYLGRVAFVPDLGMDNIQQLLYNENTGRLTPTTTLECGPENLKPHGPRYMVFHPKVNMAFVVNELSSTVSAFEFQTVVANDLQPREDRSTLKFIQCVSTIPSAFPRHLNTCGRISCDPTGRYVLVSNRGHNSIAVFHYSTNPSTCGQGGRLSIVSYCHTRGRTPRHFQFDPTGQFLLCANQDTNNITIFRFNKETGELSWTGQVYDVLSPNFICCCNPYRNNRRSSKL